MGLSATESLCPVCLKRVPADRVQEGDDVYLVKTCPDHGEYRAIVWRGAPDYKSWSNVQQQSETVACQTPTDRGCPFDCGLCPQHLQRTCCVLLEVTSRCDLGCPVCFASAGESPGPDPDLAEIKAWYELLAENTGQCNIQLSGGEPTMRADLPEIITLGREMGFSFIQLNTNGLRLGAEPEYASRLKDAGLNTVFLQFDGLDDGIYESLRGAALLGIKERAIANCAAADLGVVLVPTLVPGLNTGDSGRLIGFALEHLPHVRGVHFQPMSYFGRHAGAPGDQDRYTLPELMRDIEAQTAGRIPLHSLHPSGCEHPLCSFSGDFVLMPDGEVRPLTSPSGSASCCSSKEGSKAAERQADFVARRWSYGGRSRAGRPASLSDAAAVPQSSGGPMAAWETFLQRVSTHSFTITAKAFQDVWNIDLERLRHCCLHVVAPDRTLVPFCAYNLTDATGHPLYRVASQTAGPVGAEEHDLARTRSTQ